MSLPRLSQRLSMSTNVVAPVAARNYKVIVMDIEGTVAPISFVSDVLFPYAAKYVESHLKEHWDESATKDAVAKLVEQSNADEKDNFGQGFVALPDPSSVDVTAFRDALLANIAWQMSLNRKTSGLKLLQGHIWKAGFESGTLVGEIYDDVHKAMQEWSKVTDLKMYIYSSGSVEAQRLVFKYSKHGSMSHLLSGYFDTAIGHKREKTSYDNIAKAINQAPQDILFLTDIYEEAAAAKEAGFGTFV